MEKPQRVLICEDSRTAAYVMYCAMKQYGYCVDAVVESGEDAIQLMMHNAPDLVLMDVGLPGINGLEAAKLIKEQSPNTRIILITASHHSIKQALQAGVDGICSKDLRGSALHSAIQSSENGKCWVDLRVAN
jgi:DNA-binding NarL/FixJ family response regulator